MEYVPKLGLDGLVKLVCAECAVEFGLTSALWELRQVDYRNFFCPNGHCMACRKPTTDPKQAELNKLRAEAQSLREQNERLTATERELKAELEVWRPRAASEGATPAQDKKTKDDA